MWIGVSARERRNTALPHPDSSLTRSSHLPFSFLLTDRPAADHPAGADSEGRRQQAGRAQGGDQGEGRRRVWQPLMMTEKRGFPSSRPSAAPRAASLARPSFLTSTFLIRGQRQSWGLVQTKTETRKAKQQSNMQKAKNLSTHPPPSSLLRHNRLLYCRSGGEPH